MTMLDTRYGAVNMTLQSYKSNAIRTARDLCYPKWVIEQIETAQSEMAVDRALANGRKAM